MVNYLSNREYAGVIVSGEDSENRGRYKVFIPELMYHVQSESNTEDVGLLCMNHVGKYRNTQSDNGIYGQYFPLHPKTRVIVKFYEEDLNTGYIDRIVGDYHSESDENGVSSAPFKIESTERDEYYQLLRTVAEDLIAISCETSSIPKNGIHIYNHRDQNVLILDEKGVHLYSKNNLDVDITGKTSINVGENTQLIVGGELSISVSGNCNIDAPKIFLNCGLSKKEDVEKAEQITFNQPEEVVIDI